MASIEQMLGELEVTDREDSDLTESLQKTRCQSGTCGCGCPVPRWEKASSGDIITWTEGSFESKLYDIAHEIESFISRTDDLFQITEVGSGSRAQLLNASRFLGSTHHAFLAALRSVLDTRQLSPGKFFSLLFLLSGN